MMDRELKNRLLFLYGLMVGLVFTPSLIDDFIWGYADDYERIPFRVFDLEIYRKVS